MNNERSARLLRYLMSRTWVSIASLLVATAVAIPTYLYLGHRFFCDERTIRQGANIDAACRLVAFSGVAAVVAILAVLQWRRPLAVVLLIEAAALTFAIGLVVADSATYIAHFPYYACYNDVPFTEVHHVGWLFAVWGVPLALILLRAFGAWTTGVERPEHAQPREPEFDEPLW